MVALLKENGLKENGVLTNKELIERMKDMVDLADASYAMLYYVFENKDW